MDLSIFSQNVYISKNFLSSNSTTDIAIPFGFTQKLNFLHIFFENTKSFLVLLKIGVIFVMGSHKFFESMMTLQFFQVPDAFWKRKKIGTYYEWKYLTAPYNQKNLGLNTYKYATFNRMLLTCFWSDFPLIVETYPSNQFRCIVRFSLMIDWHASICFSLCGKGPRNFPLWTRTRWGAGM